MRWNKITSANNLFLYWECVFVNVPFSVRVFDDAEGVKARLFFTAGDQLNPITSKIYPSIDVAQAEVESFVLSHLALYSAQVHRECLEANVMTWRKLQEQLDQIPENQLDEAIRVLDSDNDWFGEPSIIKAEEDKYSLEINGHDTKYTEEEQCIPEVEVGHYYLDIEL